MSEAPVVIAIDCGAESGRVIVASEQDGGWQLDEVSRFVTGGRDSNHGRLQWDLEAIWDGIRNGLQGAGERYGERIRGVGADTWGVDYVLTDAHGTAIAPAWCYRDARTAGWPERAAQMVDAAEWWQRTGIRPLVFNTAYQLLAHYDQAPAELERARHCLLMSDWINAQLSGVCVNEWTNASTTQLQRAGGAGWDTELLQHLGLPTHLFSDPVRSGTVLGPVKPGLGLPTHAQVVAAPGHDTAAAVAAMPENADGAAFISCGTWSLMGVVRPEPVLTEAARTAQLSNELAWDGQTRLLKNIAGLWVVQECRRAFAADGRDYDYSELTERARAAADAAAVLDVDDPRFFAPGSDADPYLERITNWYAERSLSAPASDGEIIRAALRGIAQAYADTAAQLGDITGSPITRIHLIGGGSRNELLVEFTAEATGCEVIAGPVEATALGTAKVVFEGLAQGRVYAAR